MKKTLTAFVAFVLFIYDRDATVTDTAVFKMIRVG